MERWDESWHRLKFWTDSSAKSERLAAQILLSDGYSNIEPSHPNGGPDSTKDAVAFRENKKWIMAVHFSIGSKPFKSILKKILDDAKGVDKHDAYGLAFVLNQELSLKERSIIKEKLNIPVDLYHLERVIAILDQPSLRSLRYQFLGIEGISNGDDSNHFDPMIHLRPLEFSFIKLNELETAYIEFISPIIQHKNLCLSNTVGILMCEKVTGSCNLKYTFFVSGKWLKWYLDGQNQGFNKGINIPVEQIYGRVPSWPDSFFEFLEAIVESKATFKWEEERDGYLGLHQAIENS